MGLFDWLFGKKEKNRDPENSLRQALKNNPEALAAFDRLSQKDGFFAMANAAGLDDAIRSGDFDQIRDLVEAGANLSAVFEDDHTPLTLAACCNNEEAINLFIKHGVDINERAMAMPPAVYFATIEGADKALLALIKAGAELKDSAVIPEPLFLATIKNKDTKVLEILLNAGLDVNAIGEENETALMRAIKTNNLVCITWLLDHGANQTLMHEGGFAAIHLAAMIGNIELIELLAKRGNINLPSENGTPLHCVAEAGAQESIIQKVISLGADKSILDNNGKTAANLAAQNGHHHLVKLLS